MSEDILPSIHASVKTEQGGPVARKGFAYQDAFAAKACLLMLVNNSIKEVWCEHYDDVVLIRNKEGETHVEFCQVKEIQLDQLWTLAVLCNQPEGIGSSIPERCVARDIFAEACTFRLVTSREVKQELRILTLPLDHSDRAPGTVALNTLLTDFQAKFSKHSFTTEKNPAYWLERTLWETPSVESLEHENINLIHSCLEDYGLSTSTETCSRVYNDLRTLVKSAAELPWRDREGRKIRKDSLETAIRRFADPYPDVSVKERLQKKLKAANLDDTYLISASELRNTFSRQYRNSTILDQINRGRLQSTVLFRLNRLRRQYDSGELEESPSQFYRRCVNEMEIIAKLPEFLALNLPEGFFEGCMYEISGRCGHRYTKGGV